MGPPDGVPLNPWTLDSMHHPQQLHAHAHAAAGDGALNQGSMDSRVPRLEGPWNQAIPHGIWEVHMGNYYCMPHQLMHVLFSTPNPGYPSLSTLKMGYPIWMHHHPMRMRMG